MRESMRVIMIDNNIHIRWFVYLRRRGLENVDRDLEGRGCAGTWFLGFVRLQKFMGVGIKLRGLGLTARVCMSRISPPVENAMWFVESLF